jgi:putative copper resistance protein D
VSETPDLAIVAARFATFGLAILLFGAAAFDLYAPTPAPRPAAAQARSAASVLLAVAALTYVALIAREASGDPGWPGLGLVAAVYTQTGFGLALGVVLLAALGLGLTPGSPGFRWPRLIVSGVAIAALAFVGHGADDSGLNGDLRVLLLAAHLLAVAAWLGALPRLYLALTPGSSDSPALLRRFGVVGAICVATVVATGAGTLIFMAVTAGGRLGSAYATALFVKLTFVFALLCVAAVNRFWLTPQVARDPERARKALRRTIVLEQALGVGALASVAVLGQLDPTM